MQEDGIFEPEGRDPEEGDIITLNTINYNNYYYY